MRRTQLAPGRSGLAAPAEGRPRARARTPKYEAEASRKHLLAYLQIRHTGNIQLLLLEG